MDTNRDEVASFDKETFSSPVEQLQEHTENEVPQQVEEPFQTSLPRKIDAWTGIFNLTSAVVSLGVLVMPFGLRQSGYGLGLALMVFTGTVTVLSFSALVTAADVTRRAGLPSTTYEQVCHSILGPLGAWFVDLNLFMLLFFSLCAFLITIVSLMSCPISVLVIHSQDWCGEATLGVRAAFHAGCIILVFPLCLLKNLAPLKYPSMLSLGFFGYVLFTMIYRCVGEIQDRNAFLPDDAVLMRGGVTVIHTFALQSLLFGRQVNIPPLHAEMRRRSESTFVLWVSGTIAVAASALFAVSGYITFGSAVTDNVLLNYESGDHLINSGRIALGISLMAKVPLLMMPLRTVTNKILARPLQCIVNTQTWHVALTGILLILSAAVAVLMKSLKNVLGMCGFTCGPMVCYIIPGTVLMVAAVMSRRPQREDSYHVPLLDSENGAGDEMRCRWGHFLNGVVLLILGLTMAGGTAIVVISKWVHG